MTAVWQDLKLALRWMVRRPGFTLMITGMLALGIAGNTVIFNIYSGLFMRPLPLPAPERLVDLDEKAPQWNLEYVGISDPDFHAWRRDNQTFELISVWDDSTFNLAIEGEAERVRGLETTHDLAELLGYRPLLGRNFTAEEDQPGGEKVALVSHAMWQRLFGGREDVLGQILRLDDTPYEIIGVLPQEAVFPDDVDLWVPLQSDPTSQDGWYLDGIGRLKPGVTLQQARQDLTRVHKSLIEERSVNEITSPRLTPLRERYLGDVRAVTTLLLGAVGLVLLIACANVAGLMLARGASRAREMGIRLSLGASRTRVIRQLLTESLVYSVLGGILGGLAGWAGLRAVVSIMAERMPEWVAFTFDWRFLVFFAAVLLLTAVLFGLMPAFQSTRLNVQQVIRDSALRGGVSAGGRRTLNGLVVAELALAFVLLIGAGLLFRTFTALQEVDPGFQVSNVLTYGVSLSPQRYSEGEQIRAFFQELIERSAALPGVTSAGAVTATPLAGHWGNFFEAEGAPERGEDEDNPVVLFRVATPEYFEAMGIKLRSGRWYDHSQGQGEENQVVVINESMARLHWPNQEAVGKRIRGGGSEHWMTVVGVAQDTKHYGLDEDMRPGVFVPFNQYSIRRMMMVLRTTVDPNTLVEPSRQLVRQLDPSLPIFSVMSMAERLDRSLWIRRAYSWVFGLFAGVALLLALGGIYGVTSYAVSQQTHEIGIRMALGARRSHVVRQVLSNGLKLLALGLVLGLAGALAAGELLSGLLLNVSALDALTYGLVTLLLAMAAMAASLAPARRAATIDPLLALRQD
ncbi:MAG TPA: ABC transporter permease [Acidobacteriota bacterium]|nr:ABC transporter permease [Acidobacteriota bacterium]